MALVIILNGTTSAGKTSLARAIQVAATCPILHVQMDGFLDMQPEWLKDHVDGFAFLPVEGVTPPEVSVETGPFGKRLMDGMRRSVAAMAEAGLDLIVDDVWMGDGEQQKYRDLLNNHQPVFVGVHAALAVAEAREVARGDRDIGQARWQFSRVHEGADYDVEVDTSHESPDVLARSLLDHLGL
ncbi:MULTISPECIES: chloramphenicol phosphotransferase CPT family protein [Hyphomonas]|jgi:chloramphenicol 3-O phosphotransferase|uniref:chloramphenicol phosphotransferase CPT family protein n=1 Tax=Hyphomonas TaxID=85 RepID=UPI003511CB77